MNSTADPYFALDTGDQFEQLLQDSQHAPVVIFKHSATCGTSAQAYDDLEEFLHANPGVRVHIVDVWSGRALSQHIAKATGVRHESPQLLVIAGGQVAWSGSHFRANARSLRQALDKLAVSAS